MHLATYASPKAPYRVAPLPPPWKRSCDILFCLAALPFLALGALLLSVLMRVFSPGPIMFTQERVGYRGRRFKIYKFRTMHVNASGGDHQRHVQRLVDTRAPMLKLDHAGDRRLIPGGRFLRATGLDELPQIVNVLRGEMSVVGPRPCMPFEASLYSSGQSRRFEVLPGLTGLWQVSGKNETTFREMAALDVRYVKQRSLALDLKIILLTPLVLGDQVVALLPRRLRTLSTRHAPVATSLATAPTAPVDERAS